MARGARPIVVTIDGPGGVGKSTAARLLATRLGVRYLDTGATYRALAYSASARGIDYGDTRALAAMAKALPLAFEDSQEGVRVSLSGSDISESIRTEGVTEAAALVAQHPEVRRELVRLQRRLAGTAGAVVEGRDAGSVIFPGAAHKFFLDATLEVRARRRQRELGARYGSLPPLEQIREQLRFRDQLDIQRRTGPLIRPRGAVRIETSRLSVAQVVARMAASVAAGPTSQAVTRSGAGS
ncbi:MAG TPA: (d)CMP kinase [bacterium]